MPYSQGLSNGFVDALNGLHASEAGQWWRQMVADPDLFVAIRNDYLNVYYRGCSLARIWLDKGEVVVATHYKYLLRPRLKPEYVAARNGIFDLAVTWPEGVSQPFITALAELTDLKAAAEPYAGGEKKAVGEIIRKHANVVDVEIALTKTDETSGSSSAKRLDISALRSSGDRLVLEFYEAKLFSNKELRAQEDAKVIGQMTTYNLLLQQYESDVRQGFLRACENVEALDGLSPTRKRMAEEVRHRAHQLEIDLRPYLVVVGIDGDQKAKGSIWSEHEDKLMKALGADRLIVRGDPKSVVLAGGASVGSIAA